MKNTLKKVTVLFLLSLLLVATTTTVVLANKTEETGGYEGSSESEGNDEPDVEPLYNTEFGPIDVA